MKPFLRPEPGRARRATSSYLSRSRGDKEHALLDIKWALFCARPVFDIVADDQAMHIRMNRMMSATVRALDAPVVELQYYANRTGPAYPDEGMDYSTKSTGSSIELSFCDSKARRTIIDACAPTAAEVLFRLEHFLVFE